MTSSIFRNERSQQAMEQAYQRRLAETPQAQSRMVKTRFGETHMLVAGPEQAPPLVVVHGGMGNSPLALWDGRPLLERFRIYALDVLGQSLVRTVGPAEVDVSRTKLCGRVARFLLAEDAASRIAAV